MDKRKLVTALGPFPWKHLEQVFWNLVGGHNLQGGLEQLVAIIQEGGSVTAQCPIPPGP